MTVIRRMPVNRLSKLIRRPGGLHVADALAAANANLDSIRTECLSAMDEKLAALQALGKDRERKPADAELETLYGLANEVLEIAGVFEMAELGEAAYSLCDLLDRARSGGGWSRPALEVHLNGLAAFRSAAGALDTETSRTMIEGLRRVAATLGGDAIPGAGGG